MFTFQIFLTFFVFVFQLIQNLYFMKQNKKIFNLPLNNYKRRGLEEGKKLKFLNGVSLIFKQY